MHSPKIKVLSLPREHFDIFNIFTPKVWKHGFKFSKFSLFILFPLTFRYSILFIYCKAFNKCSNPGNSKPQLDAFNLCKPLKNFRESVNFLNLHLKLDYYLYLKNIIYIELLNLILE